MGDSAQDSLEGKGTNLRSYGLWVEFTGNTTDH